MTNKRSIRTSKPHLSSLLISVFCVGDVYWIQRKESQY